MRWSFNSKKLNQHFSTVLPRPVPPVRPATAGFYCRRFHLRASMYELWPEGSAMVLQKDDESYSRLFVGVEFPSICLSRRFFLGSSPFNRHTRHSCGHQAAGDPYVRLFYPFLACACTRPRNYLRVTNNSRSSGSWWTLCVANSYSSPKI